MCALKYFRFLSMTSIFSKSKLLQMDRNLHPKLFYGKFLLMDLSKNFRIGIDILTQISKQRNAHWDNVSNDNINLNGHECLRILDRWSARVCSWNNELSSLSQIRHSQMFSNRHIPLDKSKWNIKNIKMPSRLGLSS